MSSKRSVAGTGPASWSPAFATTPGSAASDGAEVTDFASRLLRVTKGFRAGEPLVFTDWQRWLTDSIYERRDDGRRRYRRVLVGLARKNGKSLVGSAFALHGLYLGPPGAEVYSCAGDKKQARIVFGEARQQVLDSPALRKISKVYRDAIEVPGEGSVYRVLSADAKLQQGLNPSLVLFDEVHVQPTEDLWDAMTQGSGARQDPLVIGITTAGSDLDTLCGRLYRYGKSVAAGEVDDDAFGFFWWEAPPECATDDRQAWERANPNLAEGLLDPDDMDASQRGVTQESAFRRFRLNQWVRTVECWLPAGAWESCVGDATFDPDRPVYVGVDMALRHDSVAVVAVQCGEDDRYRVSSRIWTLDGDTVDVAAVEAHLRELHRSWDVREFAYDPAYFQRSAEALLDDGLPMVEFPQSQQRMVPACQIAYQSICNQRVIHDGGPALTDHVLSAAARSTDTGWRLSKGKSKRKIDAAVALVIALGRATQPVEPESDVFAY
jgi:phage terminase large subunit-like protein